MMVNNGKFEEQSDVSDLLDLNHSISLSFYALLWNFLIITLWSVEFHPKMGLFLNFSFKMNPLSLSLDCQTIIRTFLSLSIYARFEVTVVTVTLTFEHKNLISSSLEYNFVLYFAYISSRRSWYLHSTEWGHCWLQHTAAKQSLSKTHYIIYHSFQSPRVIGY